MLKKCFIPFVRVICFGTANSVNFKLDFLLFAFSLSLPFYICHNSIFCWLDFFNSTFCMISSTLLMHAYIYMYVPPMPLCDIIPDVHRFKGELYTFWEKMVHEINGFCRNTKIVFSKSKNFTFSIN